MASKRRNDDDDDFAKPTKKVSFNKSGNGKEEVNENYRAERDEEDLKEDEEELDDKEDFTGGFKLEPFNMRDERDEGHFDEAGSWVDQRYSRSRERNNENFLKGEKIRQRKGPRLDDEEDEETDERDPWLEEYDEQMEVLHSKGKKLPTGTPKGESFEDLEKAAEPVNEIELKKTILSFLEPNESVTTALKRLAKDKSKTADFNKLTDAAQILIGTGYLYVYSDKKETIERDVNKREKKDDKKSKPQAVKPKATWEYKVGEQLFGPYSTEEMLQWRDGGYFVGENVVPVRRVGNTDNIFDEEEEWKQSDQIDFSHFS